MAEANGTTQWVSWEGDDDFAKEYERFVDEVFENTWIERRATEVADKSQEIFEMIPRQSEKPGKKRTASGIRGCRKAGEGLASVEAHLSQEVNSEEIEIKKLEEELSKRKARAERLECQRSEVDQQVAEFGYRQHQLEQHMLDLQDGESSEKEYNEEESTSDANLTQEPNEEGDEEGEEEYDEGSDEGYDEAEHQRLLSEQHDVDTGQAEFYYEPIPDHPGRVFKRIRYL